MKYKLHLVSFQRFNGATETSDAECGRSNILQIRESGQRWARSEELPVVESEMCNVIAAQHKASISEVDLIDKPSSHTRSLIYLFILLCNF